MSTIRERSKIGRRRVLAAPTLVFLLLSTAIVMLWHRNVTLEHDRYVAEANVVAQQLCLRIEEWFEARTAIMLHMAGHLDVEVVKDDAFRKAARSTIATYPGFQALNWVDRTGRIAITVPSKGNEGALGKNLFEHPEPAVVTAIRSSSNTSGFVLSPIIDLLQGGKGVAVYHAVRRDGQIAGYLNGVFRIDALSKLWLADPQLVNEFWIDLQEQDGGVVSATTHAPPREEWTDRAVARFHAVDTSWTLTVAASPAHIGETLNGANSLLLLVFGILLAAAISILLWQALVRQAQLRMREMRSRHLLAWSTQLQHAEDYPSIAAITIEEVRAQTGYRAVWSMISPMNDGDDWRFLFISGKKNVAEYPTMRTEDDPLLRACMSSNSVQIIEDARQDPQANQEIVSRTGIRTMINVPMHLVDRCLGVFGAGTHGEDGVRMPTDAEREYLVGMGAHLTLAISRIRLLEERQRDAKQRARIERQVYATQKLESLGLLAGGIAHDFNNILVAIMGNADLALIDHAEDRSVQVYLEQIVESSQRAAELCNQMLAFSGGGHSKRDQLDLNQLVGGMAKLLGVSISKNASFKMRCAEDLPALSGDATQLRQVIMNLITNASDALSAEGGTITVETGRIVLSPELLDRLALSEDLPQQEYLFLCVRDDGCGMDEPTRARIFDPFFTTKSAGRGLGLAAVLGIIRSHKGAVKVSSTPGEGSAVTVFLPPNVADQAAVEIQDTVTIEGAGGRILVVDDEREVRMVARSMLESGGYEVLEAADGPQGLELFRERFREIDLLLIDMTMPRMNGVELFEEARRIDPEIRAVLSSGYSESFARQDLGKHGLSAFVAKPYDRMSLLSKVSQALNSSSQAAS